EHPADQPDQPEPLRPLPPRPADEDDPNPLALVVIVVAPPLAPLAGRLGLLIRLVPPRLVLLLLGRVLDGERLEATAALDLPADVLGVHLQGVVAGRAGDADLHDAEFGVRNAASEPRARGFIPNSAFRIPHSGYRRSAGVSSRNRSLIDWSSWMRRTAL